MNIPQPIQEEQTKENGDEKNKEEDQPPITLHDFLMHSFETIFEQNYRLHAALNDSLEKRFKELKQELTQEIQLSTEEIKQGFLFYTRDIMQGINDANDDLKCYVSKRDWDSMIQDPCLKEQIVDHLSA